MCLLGYSLMFIPQDFQEVLKVLSHLIELILWIMGNLFQSINLFLCQMPAQCQFLSIMFQTLLTLGSISSFSYPLNNFLKMIFYIILNIINLDNVFSQVIILNISNLSILITFLHQVFKMIGFHFLDNLDQSIVKSRGMFNLLLIVSLETAELLDVLVVLTDYLVAHCQDLEDLLVNRLIGVLWIMRQVILSFAVHNHTFVHPFNGFSFNFLNLYSPGCQLSSTSTTIILQFLSLLHPCNKFCLFIRMIHTIPSILIPLSHKITMLCKLIPCNQLLRYTIIIMIEQIFLLINYSFRTDQRLVLYCVTIHHPEDKLLTYILLRLLLQSLSDGQLGWQFQQLVFWGDLDGGLSRGWGLRQAWSFDLKRFSMDFQITDLTDNNRYYIIKGFIQLRLIFQFYRQLVQRSIKSFFKNILVYK